MVIVVLPVVAAFVVLAFVSLGLLTSPGGVGRNAAAGFGRSASRHTRVMPGACLGLMPTWEWCRRDDPNNVLAAAGQG